MKEKWKKAYSSVRRFMRAPRSSGHEHWKTQDFMLEPLNLIPALAAQYAWALSRQCFSDNFVKG